jgi:hypothetical protein
VVPHGAPRKNPERNNPERKNPENNIPEKYHFLPFFWLG